MEYETEQQHETFEWSGMRFDISALLADIDRGALRPRQMTLPTDFVASYGSTVLGLDRAKRDVDQLGTFFVGISSLRALALPREVLSRPVVLLYAGKLKGLLNMGDGGNYVLADGNHRVARAFLDARDEGVPAYVLTPDESRRYRT